MRISGKHWSPDLKARLTAALRRPGVVPAHVADQFGLRRGSVQRLARELKAEPMPEPSRPYIAPHLPSSEEPLADLIRRRRETASRVIEADDARKLIPIKLTMPGPIGLFCMGDPHLDNDGCDFPRLEADLMSIAGEPRVLALSIGDVTDNWTGRLERLYAASSVKAADGWRLAEWLFSYPGINWLGSVAGNHDKWSGHRDPLKWITKARVALHEDDVLRLALNHPNGQSTRIHARHDFKGSSIYSDMHGLKRESLMGWRDHLLVAGHRHLGEDGAFINPDGFVTQLLRLCGYKRADSYAVAGQFKAKPMHPSALVIINPDRAEAERGRVWVAPSVEEGVDWLNFQSRRAA
jgi:transposase-like protein